MSPTEIYEAVKAEFERLERNATSRGEWLSFSTRLLDAVMKCQAIVLEHQKRLLAQTRSAPDGDEYRATRQASRDGIQVLDQLLAIHERTRAKLARPER